MPTGKARRIVPAGGLMIWRQTPIGLSGEQVRIFEHDFPELCHAVLDTSRVPGSFVAVQVKVLGMKRRFRLQMRVRLQLMRQVPYAFHMRQIRDIMFIWLTKPANKDLKEQRRLWLKKQRDRDRQRRRRHRENSRAAMSRASAADSQCA